MMKELNKKITEEDFEFHEYHVEVRGVKYSYDLFRAWGRYGLEVGAKYRLLSREDGVVTVEKLIDE